MGYVLRYQTLGPDWDWLSSRRTVTALRLDSIATPIQCEHRCISVISSATTDTTDTFAFDHYRLSVSSADTWLTPWLLFFEAMVPIICLWLETFAVLHRNQKNWYKIQWVWAKSQLICTYLTEVYRSEYFRSFSWRRVLRLCFRWHFWAMVT